MEEISKVTMVEAMEMEMDRRRRSGGLSRLGGRLIVGYQEEIEMIGRQWLRHR
jgi:hypothetical protein